MSATQANPYKLPVEAPKTAFNIDAEQAFLGAVLFDNTVLDRLSIPIAHEHFYDPVHQLIFDTMDKLITDGRVASPVTLSAYLAHNPILSELGGDKYLSDLATNVPSTAGAGDYARVIYDMALSRGLVELTEEINGRARELDLDDDPISVIEDAEAGLYRLAEQGNYSKGFVGFDHSLSKTMEMIDAAYAREGGLAGFSCGLKSLDEKLGGLHQSDLIILAGRPSMGKTALATNIAVKIAAQYQGLVGQRPDDYNPCVHGGIVGFFSLEMSHEQLTQRVLAERAGISSDRLRRGKFDQADYDRVYDANRKMESLPLHIDDTGAISISQLAARARRLKRQKGLDILIIDYLQLMTTGSYRRDNRTAEITEITMGLKALAKELNIPIIALSQLSRNLENRVDKRPQLSDLRESGSIEQDADVVMFVYREEYYLARTEPDTGTPEHLEWQTKSAEVAGLAEVIIGKQRHGPIGTARLRFKPETTAFEDEGNAGAAGETAYF